MATNNPITLTNWRQIVAEMYAKVRHSRWDAREAAWSELRESRDLLFAQHPQTPLNASQLAAFTSIPYFGYDPAFAVLARVNLDVPRETFETQLAVDGRFRYTRVAELDFELHDRPRSLNLYWIEGYGGALYLPFGDTTNGSTTYGGGRYLYDAIKGADLGTVGERLVLDFNFAYNPSCAYNDLWSCPLPPAENKLGIAIEAGEKKFG